MKVRVTSRIAGSMALGLCALAGSLLSVTAAGAATDALTNGNLAQPGTNGANPTGWTVTNFDNETAPYAATINEYNSSGAYPPPSPIPGGNSFASEVFYEAGSATGSEGIGGQQSVSGVSDATDGQLSYSTAEFKYPATSVASWAGSVFEVDFSNSSQNYELRFFNSFTPATTGSSAAYASAPTNSSTVEYVVGPKLVDKQWYSAGPIDLSAAIQTAFGFTSYTVTGVRFGDLEGTTSSGSPYPNMTSYFAAMSLSPSPPPGLPEVPLLPLLPVTGLAVVATATALRTRRRHQRAIA